MRKFNGVLLLTGLAWSYSAVGQSPTASLVTFPSMPVAYALMSALLGFVDRIHRPEPPTTANHQREIEKEGKNGYSEPSQRSI